MFIIYINYDESIICTPETEPETIRIWFTEGGRDLEEYDRIVRNNEAVCISAKLSL